MEQESEKISKAEYARRFNLSRARVTQLVKAGRLEVDDKGYVFVKSRVKGINKTLNKSTLNTPINNSEDEGNLKERSTIAKVIQNECKAELLKIQVSKEQTQVIDLDQAQNIAIEAFELLKSSLLLLPLKLAVQLEGQDARYIEATLEDEIKQCLFETVRKLDTFNRFKTQ